MLKSEIEKSYQWMIQSASLVDGLDIDSSERNCSATSLFHLCIEHQQAVHTLANNGLIGSAFALLRPQFEAYIRGVWYFRCASDVNVIEFIKGAEPPRIKQLLSDIERLSDFDSQSLDATKKAVWGILNDFTHGGTVQVRARMTENEIVSCYKIEHIVGMMYWSAILSFMGYLGMASIANNDLLANNLREQFHLIYSVDLTLTK